MDNIKRSKPFKKWFLLIIISFILLIIESTEILAFFGNIKPFLVFPFAISCSIFLKKEEAPFIGVVCGLFLDCFSKFTFGLSAIILLIFCTATSIIFKRFINVRLINILIVNFCMFLVYSLFQTLMLYLFGGIDDFGNFLLFNIFPVLLYTIAVSPLLFLVAKNICFNGKLERIVRKNKQKYKKKLKLFGKGIDNEEKK